jgi:predicted dehydrogenase
METNGRRRLRFGILSTARIAPAALIEPAPRAEVDVVAVAARDPKRADAFATAHGIRAVSRSYTDLLERNDLDAVYIPLPAVYRHEWTLRALERDLHVLAEKPIAMDAGQAREMVDTAQERGLVLAEGFHYLFHPMFDRTLELLDEGVIGELEHIETVFDGAVPRGPESVIYLDPALGGGALLHQACYALHAACSLAGAEPRVVRAHAAIGATGVDEAVSADLVFPTGATAHIRASMEDGAQLLMQATVRGTQGLMQLDNFIGPHYGNVEPTLGGRIVVRRDAHTALEESFTGETTYTYQLRAFREAVLGGSALPVQGLGAIANITLIDAVRDAAGIQLHAAP